jgi:hypothetical protein
MTTATSLSLISERFGDDVRVFSLFNLMQGIGAAAGMVVSIFISEFDPIYYLGFMLIYTFIASLFMYSLPRFI